MKKKYIKRTVGILLLIVAAAAVCFVMQALVLNRDDGNLRRLKGFYMEEENSLDAVFMGSSEVMNDYAAAEVYRSEGITSYAYAFPINSVLLWKYELADIERTQHPQVLIIDINGAVYEDDEYIHSDYCICALAESIPMTANRIKLAFDLSDEPLERLFPLIKFHYKWKNIFNLDENANLILYKNGYSRFKGMTSKLYREKKGKDFQPIPDTTGDLNPDAESALREFLEICKESDIENIVFVEFPHINNNDEMHNRLPKVNKAAEIIQAEGFEFINFDKQFDEIGLDYETDYFDSHHMVVPGQQKFSKYIGSLIRQKYISQPKKQSEKNKARWEESVAWLDKYCEYYYSFTKEHADDPYEEVDFNLGDNVKTNNLLKDLK